MLTLEQAHELFDFTPISGAAPKRVVLCRGTHKKKVI